MTETGELPVLLAVRSGEFHDNLGAAWADVADGSIIRVSNLHTGRILGYVRTWRPADRGAVTVGSDEFRSRRAYWWGRVADGAVLAVTDLRGGRVLGVVTRDAPPELAGCEASLPSPRWPSDSLVRDEPRSRVVLWRPAEPPPDWVVRQAPDPEPQEASA